MTRDFRQPSPHRIGPQPASTAGSPGEQGQRVLLRSLLFASLVFVCAGVWLLTQAQDLIPPDVAPILGMALIFVAMTDALLARFLKRLWERKRN
jgi:hypothetical protein